MQLIDGWSDAPPYSHVPGAEFSVEDIATIRREFDELYPEYIDDKAWDFNVTTHLLVMATERSDLHRLRSDIRPGSAALDRVFDRVHEFLQARTRTPKRTLSAPEALRLAEQHLEQVIKMRGTRDEVGLADVLERVGQLSVVVQQSADACDRGASLFRWYLEPDSIGLRAILSDNERRLLFFRDDFVDFDALADFDSDLTLAQIFHASESMTHDDLLTYYVLQPCHAGPLDSSSYYELWAAGASLWVTADSFEVRTFTAARGTNAQYQG